MQEKFKIPGTMLTPRIDAQRLGFADTSELTPLEEPIGQPRAVEALEFGLTMQSRGFNIYVSGPIGTGKWSIVRQMVQRLAQAGLAAPDWCYLHNFQEPSRPRRLAFPAGQGRAFVHEMEALIHALQHDIPTAFESAKYLDARAKIVDDIDAKKKALFAEVNNAARARGFGFQEEAVGFTLVPQRDGRTMTEEERRTLSAQERHDLEEQRKEIEGKIREFQSRLHTFEHEAERALRQIDQDVVQSLLERRMGTLRISYHYTPEVIEYLDQVSEDIVTHYKDFLPQERQGITVLALATGRQPDLVRYEVNLIVEHKADEGAPIVDESHPTYANLVGKIERKAHLGVVYTDFTEIRAGACVQASGGYLILNAIDLLRQPFAWEALKRVIKTREVNIEDPGEFFGFSTIGLKPQPIPVDLKVILLGPPFLYNLLQTYEEDFQTLFKVKADFDIDMKRGDEEDQPGLRAAQAAGVCETGGPAVLSLASARRGPETDRLGFHRDLLRRRWHSGRSQRTEISRCRSRD